MGRGVANDEHNPEYKMIGTNEYAWGMLSSEARRIFLLVCPSNLW